MDELKERQTLSGYTIPPRPETLKKLEAIREQPEPEIAEFTALIASDVGLSAAVLNVINSPFYGLKRKVSDIKQGVVILGVDKVYNLIVCHFLMNSFSNKSSISLERFWDESQNIANILVFLVGYLDLKSEVNAEELYSFGLFHNCGIPILAQRHDDYPEVLSSAEIQGENSIRAEEKQYNTNHAVMGYYLCKSWGLSKDLCEYIFHHHDVTYINNTGDRRAQLFLSLLVLADDLLSQYRKFSHSPDWEWIGNRALSVLKIDLDGYEELKEEVLLVCEAL